MRFPDQAKLVDVGFGDSFTEPLTFEEYIPEAHSGQISIEIPHWHQPLAPGVQVHGQAVNYDD